MLIQFIHIIYTDAFLLLGLLTSMGTFEGYQYHQAVGRKQIGFTASRVTTRILVGGRIVMANIY